MTPEILLEKANGILCQETSNIRTGPYCIRSLKLAEEFLREAIEALEASIENIEQS